MLKITKQTPMHIGVKKHRNFEFRVIAILSADLRHDAVFAREETTLQ
jgi:hypothetical protein